MPTAAPIHPAALLKNVVREYLSSFIPPDAEEGAVPIFGDVAGIPVTTEEDCETLEPSGPDISIFETAGSTDLHEGADVWTFTLGIALTLPIDRPDFQALAEALWQYLTAIYDPATESPGGDCRSPLAGRLNAASLFLCQESPGDFPRLLCVSDAWDAKKLQPELDGAAARVAMFSVMILAEVLPPQ